MMKPFKLTFFYFSNSNRSRRNDIHRIPLPPPQYGAPSFNPPKTSNHNSFRPSAPSQKHGVTTNPHTSSASDNQVLKFFVSLAVGLSVFIVMSLQ